MSTYVDASVLLRIVLREPDPLPTWPTISNPVSSELLRVECLRTIDRGRIRLGLDDDVVARLRADTLEAIDAFTLISLDRSVLDRATEPFPTLLGTLGAIHLASAVLAREQLPDLTFTTHDLALGTAALAVGFAVAGVPLP